ncbi:MAG TPA: peptidoglycan-binding protein LysM [Thermoanaerobaculia bacterium]
MGLIQFAKNVGKKLGLGDDDKKPQPAQAPQSQGAGGPTAQEVQQLEERKKEVALAGLLKQMGFNTESLVVDMEGDKVTLRGRVDTQADREKMVLVVGNHEGIAAVDDQLTVVNPEPEAQYYEVQSGDNLSKIAKQFYGNPNKYHQIFEANRPMLKDPDEIYPGQKLRIPPDAKA